MRGEQARADADLLTQLKLCVDRERFLSEQVDALDRAIADLGVGEGGTVEGPCQVAARLLRRYVTAMQLILTGTVNARSVAREALGITAPLNDAANTAPEADTVEVYVRGRCVIRCLKDGTVRVRTKDGLLVDLAPEVAAIIKHGYGAI